MAPGPRAKRRTITDHESFLRHARFRWLKIGVGLCVLSLLGFIVAGGPPEAYGGTWYGYTLGTIGTGLIVWLSLLGIRKRAMTTGSWSLKAWTSAHVYLGLALIVVVTLHSGLHFGWNVHTLAYVLMLLVILSGAFGVIVYTVLPAALSSNRDEMTQSQMIDGIRAIDRQLHDAAQPLPREYAELVLAAIARDTFAPGLFSRLSGRDAHCATQRAVAAFQASGGSDASDLGRVEKLLIRRKAQLDRIRRQMRLRAMLEVWLYIHIPATVALLAALTAHILSVFFYW